LLRAPYVCTVEEATAMAEAAKTRHGGPILEPDDTAYI
jgi:predicted TIM-barrel enzyme